MILGKTIAKIIASEKSITELRLDDAPTTINNKNNILYDISAARRIESNRC